tara:strand:+ start:270 stop:1187 length:918 start_codon:yes stop_codon:yes gene_type:complete
MIGLRLTKGIDMQIILNRSLGVILLLTACQPGLAIEAKVSTILGVQSKPYGLGLPASHGQEVDKDILNVRSKLYESMVLDAPDFHWFETSGSFQVLKDIKLEPFFSMSIRPISTKTGVRLVYDIPTPFDTVRFKALMSAYKLSNPHYEDNVPWSIYLDANLLAEIDMMDQVQVEVSYSYPVSAVSKWLFSGVTFDVEQRQVLSVGVRFQIWPTEEKKISNYIVQDPIAIPVVNLVIDDVDEMIEVNEDESVEDVAESVEPYNVLEPGVNEQSLDGVVIEEPEEVVEEDLSWFAWIIEYIARLFRL